jgi:hypothetical protein
MEVCYLYKHAFFDAVSEIHYQHWVRTPWVRYSEFIQAID